MVTVPTPLGDVEVAVTAGDPAPRSPHRTSTLPTGSQVRVWSEVEGLAVDALLISTILFEDSELDFPPTRVCAVEWRLHASRETRSVTVSALLAGGAERGSAGGGEGLVATEFFTTPFVLAIGGPDEELLAEQAREGRQPESWQDVQVPELDYAQGRGIVWHLPGLRAGESAGIHAAVAWCPTGHPGSDVAPWFGVDVSPDFIRRTAGLMTSFPSPFVDDTM